MVPPMLLYLRIDTPGHRIVGLWLPLFLVWLILLPLIVLVFAVTVLVDLVLILTDQPYHHYTLLLLHMFEVLGASRGTTVHVHSTTTNVDIELV